MLRGYTISGRLRKWPKMLRKRVMKRDNYCCRICGSKEDLTIDHIIPVSKDGSNRENNLQVLCIVCNQRKGSEILPQFIRI